MTHGVRTEVLCSFHGGPKDGATVRMPVAEGKPPETVTVNGTGQQVTYQRRRAGKRWIYEHITTP